MTGQSFADVMRQQVFAPLGMDDSHYAPLDAALHERAASGHVGGTPIPGKGPIHVESAAGGLWTTPSDLMRLMAEAMRAYRGEEGPVLGPEVVQEMLTPAFWDFGLGFRVLGKGSTLRFSHGGATRGWHGQIHAYPERGQSVAVLTNGANGYVVWPEVARGIAHSLGWPGWAPETVQPLVRSATEIEVYAGTYGLAGLTFEVRARELGAIEPKTPGIGLHLDDLTWTAVPTKPDVFELLEFEGQVLFERAEDGTIAGFEIWFGQPDWSPYRRWRFERC